MKDYFIKSIQSGSEAILPNAMGVATIPALPLTNDIYVNNSALF